ncbi:DUF2281 domain-containing protein [Floridanema aerugineum]|uniref:DUF2281 domain-containing protein n=1 Tax=Floridaenema aerugineum BLCC-F46 TaxID=3153654 RepID=A0ABV4X406_9CYAN
MSIEQLVIQKLQTLSPQKQQEVLDFVEFLQSKSLPEESSNQQLSESASFLTPPLRIPDIQGALSQQLSERESASFLTLAQKWVGCIDAPRDLSTNKKYLDGYGNE